MSHSLKGWVRLVNLRSGAVFVTRDGILAVKTEYRYTSHNPQPMCILLDSGQYAHFPGLDREWVMEIEVTASEVLL
uniref:Uncharacterized protein n=1 Tax=viral metagenome TaxID=1070528 RepID=A0A6M3KJK8_9ZZZZ